MKNIFFVAVSLLAAQLNAQKFIQPKSDTPLTFTEIQRQYDEWARKTDLTKERGWKYFKRWEMDMQLHTDAKGERTDPSDYINAAINVANEKQRAASSRMSSSGWYPVGPNILPGNLTGYMENGMGRINCMAFHPTNPSTYYVGVAQGGVWKTSNDGASWTPLTDNLPITRISDICIDPNDPDSTIYISVCDYEYIGVGLFLNGRKRNTHYGLGVYKTTDGGATWNPTGLAFQLTDGDASLIRKIIIDPSNSNTLLACGVSGMFRSTDAGVTWTNVNNALFWDMLQDPTAPNTLYAASGWVANANAGSAGIYKSTDFGLTWTLLNTGIPPTGTVERVKLAIAPSDHNYLYAVTVNTAQGLYGIYKTTNAGLNWTFVNPGVNVLEAGDGTSPGGQGNYDLGLMVNPTNRSVLYTGGVNLWGSADGGQTFDPASHWTLYYGATLHGDIHFITRNPLSGNIFVCSDGGIYRTSGITTETWVDANNGIPWPTQWTNISNGMQITSFYRISSSQNSAGRLVGGAQDNATFYFDNGVWNTIFGGDGMDNYLDPVNNDNIIGSSQYGYFYRSFDDGVSDAGTYPNINSEAGEWTTPLVADYNQYGTLYAGFQNVAKTSDNGNSWTMISSFPPTPSPQELSALAVAHSNSSVIYAAKRVRYEYGLPGILYKTVNGGASWTNVTAGLPDSLYYTSVEISETDANTVYVTMAGFSAGNKVFKTTNGGSTWTNISYNLPNIPVNCVKYIPGSGGTIMLATDLGIYVLPNAATSWTNQSSGLPNVITSDIEFNIPLNKIYISTFGRGIWATDYSTFTGISPVLKPVSSLELFPSLNNGSFTIRMPSDASANEKLSLEIIDITGRIAASSTLQGQTSYELSFPLAPGMYYARVEGAVHSGVKNFIVR